MQLRNALLVFLILVGGVFSSPALVFAEATIIERCACALLEGEATEATTTVYSGNDWVTITTTREANSDTCRTFCENLADGGPDNETALVVSSTYSQLSIENNPSVIPKLNVDIPGLTFSQPLRVNGRLNINFLGEYLVGIYRWLVGVAMVFAVIMIIVGGVQYTISGGQSGVKAAKDRIKNALIGVVILLASFLLLNVTNPQLTMFRPLQLAEQPPIIEESEEAEVSGATLATSFTAPQTANIVGAGAKDVPSDLTSAVESAANELAEDDYGMHITSSFRTPEKQVELIIKNCQNPPGSATCNPKPGRPGTCMMRGNDPARCPHTSGYALDIWATGKNCVSSQATCQANLTTCRNNPCQAALISAMRNNGFCNLASEPWHFENPKMSSTCN